LNYHSKIPSRISRFFLAVTALAILFFGLNPKDFTFSNRVDWIQDQAGLRFSRYGMAHSDVFIESLQAESSESNNFSLEIALKPEKSFEDGFRFIFMLHDGRDSRQLLMAQWRSWIIFMNGDDYDHKRKTKRLAVDASRLPPGPLFFTLTTGSHGTDLYCGGTLLQTEKDLVLDLPAGRETRLVIGNSLDGVHPWEGEVYGLALYQSALADRAIARHFSRWSQERSFAFATPDRPLMLFLLDEKEGRYALDRSGESRRLSIPKRMTPLQLKILELPRPEFEFNRSSIVDICVNALGFIPFGFFLCAVLSSSSGSFKRHGVIVTVGLCLTASLFIEIVQAWVPSRSSSASDLILNVFGGWIGAVVYRLVSMAPLSGGPVTTGTRHKFPRGV
jgi:VanZ family protein